MNCKTKEIEIPQENPFQHCKLGRGTYASILTKVVSNLDEGGVFSICGDWGTGKTTFVKMWEQQLKNEQFQTLYFNVWEHDFLSDPLVGIITQFRKLVPIEKAKQTLASISNSFMSILCGVAPKIAKATASHYLGSEATEVLEAAVDKASESFDSILNKFEEQSKSIEEFRTALHSYVELVSPDKPIIFIVDELDRCNPHYAVKTLERIKHLFNIQGVIFVLSIDKAQLCNSIRGYFGSEQLNAEDYLKRFIDFEYQLPKPMLKTYCKYLFDLYGFGDFFDDTQRRQYFRTKDESSEFLDTTETLFSNMNFNLRQIEKQFVHLRIALQTFRTNCYVHPGIIVLLEYIRQKHYDFYQKLSNKEYSIDELVAKLEDLLPHSVISQSENCNNNCHRFLWVVAKFICCYAHDDRDWRQPIELVTKGNNPELTFTCKVFNKEKMLDMIKHNVEHEHFNGILDIRELIDHLELLKDFTMN